MMMRKRCEGESHFDLNKRQVTIAASLVHCHAPLRDQDLMQRNQP
jgi:hypothetical protein